MFSNGYFLLSIVLAGVGFLVQRILISKMKKYGGTPLSRAMSGKQIAESMLQYYNIRGVQVVEGQGMLTDHYNPSKRLSPLAVPIHKYPKLSFFTSNTVRSDKPSRIEYAAVCL